jgi:chorismate mutase
MKTAGTKGTRGRRGPGRGPGRADDAGRPNGAAPPSDPFETLRRAIDGIDRRVVRLLNERAGCAIALGRVKKARGLPVYQPAREEEVLRNVERANAGPLEASAVRRLFERIIDESRRIERVGTETEAVRSAAERRAGGAGEAEDD